jgi:hypothetical protein
MPKTQNFINLRHIIAMYILFFKPLNLGLIVQLRMQIGNIILAEYLLVLLEDLLE